MTQDIIEAYRLLGLEPGAPIQAVKAAYRELLMVWHPDRFPNDSKLSRRATEKTADLNAAYRKISAYRRTEDSPNYQRRTSEKSTGEPSSAKKADTPPPVPSADPDPPYTISRCPHCDQEITLEDSMIATWLVCPHCSQEFMPEPPSRDGRPICPQKKRIPPIVLPKDLPWQKSARRKILEQRFEELGADGVIDEEDRTELASLCVTLSLDISELSELEAAKHKFLIEARKRVLAERYAELVANGTFSKRDEQELRFVAACLALDTAEVQQIRREGARLLVRNRLNRLLVAGSLTSQGIQELRKLAASEGLSDAAVDQIIAGRVQEECAPVLARIRSSLTMTEGDFAALEGLERKYRCKLNLGSEISLYRSTFFLESGRELPDPTSTGLLLEGNEVAYFCVMTRWHQSRMQKYGFGGVSVSLPSGIRGVRFRFGSYTPIQAEQLTCLSEGWLYVTSARLLFQGNSRNTSITMGRIIDCEIFSDALKIEKSSGKPDFFTMNPAQARHIVALLGFLKQA